MNIMNFIINLLIILCLATSPLAIGFCDQASHGAGVFAQSKVVHHEGYHGHNKLGDDQCCSSQIPLGNLQHRYELAMHPDVKDRGMPPSAEGLLANFRPAPLLEPPSHV